MLTDCDASIDIQQFEGALRPILPRRRASVRSIGFVPSDAGIAVEVRCRQFTGTATMPKTGTWRRRIVTEGPMLARLIGKLGTGELKLTYAAGRLYLNRLSVAAREISP